jgi:futalosine hydrolase
MPVAPARLLFVSAVAAERDAAAAGLDVAESFIGPYPSLTATTRLGRIDFIAGGVGAAAAAAVTATALGAANYTLVVSAGIAGAFAPVEVGTTVVADAVIAADLGAEAGDGWLSLEELGLGATRYQLDQSVTHELARRSGARVGAILTVATVTGTAATAAIRRARWPDALAEGMEGAGVVLAAQAHSVAVAELRTVSNAIGPRDRDAWEVPRALRELGRAVSAVVAEPWEVLS